MSRSNPQIQSISDTARWAAVYRAHESDRADAVFRDPFARRLAGERGEEIAAVLSRGGGHAWAWITRTYVVDRFITQEVAQGVDMVVNLAAGLDTRPFRMELPASLKWIEVDLPELLAYKEDTLRGETPACRSGASRPGLVEPGGSANCSTIWAQGDQGADCHRGFARLSLGAPGRVARTGPRQSKEFRALGDRHRLTRAPANPSASVGAAARFHRGDFAVRSQRGPRILRPSRLEADRRAIDAEVSRGLEPALFLDAAPGEASRFEGSTGLAPWSGACLLERES